MQLTKPTEGGEIALSTDSPGQQDLLYMMVKH